MEKYKALLSTLGYSAFKVGLLVVLLVGEVGHDLGELGVRRLRGVLDGGYKQLRRLGCVRSSSSMEPSG